MEVVLILNDPPYGSERSYNALRLADQLVTNEDIRLTLCIASVGIGHFMVNRLAYNRKGESGYERKKKKFFG